MKVPIMHNQSIGILRSATKEDVSAIRALTRAAYSKWVPVINREPVPMTTDYALAIRIHRFDLLEQAGALVALAETVLHPTFFWIENLAVSPVHHGRGLGRQMLRHAEHVARSLGHTDIKLQTNRAFTGNIAFYEREGFVVEREEPFKGGITAFLSKAL